MSNASTEFSNTLSIPEVEQSISRLIEVSEALSASNFKAHTVIEEVIDVLYQRFQVTGQRFAGCAPVHSGQRVVLG